MASYATYPSLAARTVLVTGGATGIGSSLVEAFCRQQARVAFLDLDAEAGARLVEKCAEEIKARPTFLRCDLRSVPDLRRSVQEIEAALGAVTVLVNNAASDDRHAVGDVTLEYWDDRMAVNLRHQFFAAQAVSVGMAGAGGGSIINMGSVGWMKANGRMAVYGAAKAAVHGLTKSLARDLGERKIRVNTVVPGWIMTQRQVERWLTPAAEQEVLARQCLKRTLQPEDVAALVLFLASDDSGGCTGQSYFVDGGVV